MNWHVALMWAVFVVGMLALHALGLWLERRKKGPRPLELRPLPRPKESVRGWYLRREREEREAKRQNRKRPGYRR